MSHVWRRARRARGRDVGAASRKVTVWRCARCLAESVLREGERHQLAGGVIQWYREGPAFDDCQEDLVHRILDS